MRDLATNVIACATIAFCVVLFAVMVTVGALTGR